MCYNSGMIDLSKTENQVTSQQGEDGVIQAILNEIGITNRVAVEFGALDGLTDNTFQLKMMSFDVFGINGDVRTNNVHEAWLTRENCNDVFKELRIPKSFDVMSVDVDFNDYYIWKALDYRPRLLIMEYNASIPPTEARVVRYEPTRTWDGTNYFGASLLALDNLCKKKGYSLVYCESMGVNAFWVRDDCMTENLRHLTVEEAYQTPKYGGNNGGHMESRETMIEVVE